MSDNLNIQNVEDSIIKDHGASSVHVKKVVSRWFDVLNQVEQMATLSGRKRDAVSVLPVTKNQPDWTVELLYSLGQRTFAENRVQELSRKSKTFARLLDIHWVMIGHLQRNKTGDVAKFASRLETLDSLRLALALSKKIETLSFHGSHTDPMPTLIQINASGEPQKYGLPPKDVPSLLDDLAKIPHLEVCGFMAMAPHVDDKNEIRKTFAKVRNLRDTLAPKWEGRFSLEQLSFGMSQDYPIAIAEGATQVRLGTTIFSDHNHTERDQLH